MEYLKDDLYYEDFYDLLTIQDCIRFESIRKGNGTKTLFDAFAELGIYYKMGEWYENKQSTIRKWKENDTNLQSLYDNAVAPLVRCSYCDGKMDEIDRSVVDFERKTNQVLFIFECKNCHKRMGVYADGTRRIHKKEKCPKCSIPLTETTNRKGQVITTVFVCPDCGYSHESTLDLESDDKEYKEKRKNDRELLEKYRDKYCMSIDEGQKYIAQRIRSDHFAELMKKEKGNATDPTYQKMKQIKTFSVIEIEKLINKALEKTKYIRLTLEKPEIDRYVAVPFTVQESDGNRVKYDSIHDLQKIIKKALEPTNWRLMTEGINYRSGYLLGKLRSYETEEELMKLATK